MLLEIILYFSLGFLAAILLVLLVAPAIWNRAVVLTKQKVESTLPLSLNEIQAEKDRLRAEYAMTTRRLELGIEELRKKASTQLVELQTRRDEANRLNQSGKEHLIKIEGLEKAAETMRTKLEENQEKIEGLNKKLLETTEELQTLTTNHEELRTRNSDTQEEFNKTKIELIASETKVDSLSGTLSTINLTDEERTLKIQSLNDELADLKKGLKEEQQKFKKSETELKSVTKKLESAEKKLEKHDANKQTRSDKEMALLDEVSDLTNKLINENAKVINLEAKLAQTMLRREIENPPEQGETTSIADLKEENSELASDIRETMDDEAASRNSEKQAALKNRIRDMAAKTAVETGHA
ncbi:MAG: hypothetical protein AAGA76_03600, partial [Pseudomonadota bacterium]